MKNIPYILTIEYYKSKQLISKTLLRNNFCRIAASYVPQESCPKNLIKLFMKKGVASILADKE